ncbi:MAG: hypothetical protein IKQ17_12320 [Kiritimatiellae bacterium]|nr:hypothetical protein [Kiritimatiellia bacterium]
MASGSFSIFHSCGIFAKRARRLRLRNVSMPDSSTSVLISSNRANQSSEEEARTREM